MSLSLDGTLDKEDNNASKIENSNKDENPVIHKSIIIENNILNSQIVPNPETGYR